MDFAKYLSDNNKKVWIRHVIVAGITLNDGYLYKLGKYLKTLNNINGIEVLPYHSMGISKYEKMNLYYPLKGVRDATFDEAIRSRQIIYMQ